MDPAAVLDAVRDFEKKVKKEACPILDQFLCHIARTGGVMVQWTQFKSYFLFKLEKVMDDFQASAPEPRGPINPNVDCIPFQEMKERILKIVNGYTGIPFTIQRLCELLTEPKRNYSGTDKFLRGLEKNVMVVSCIYPTSEKNGNVGRMNGVMFPGNPSAFLERSTNGPGTPRPLNRPKLTLSSSLATNGLPDNISREPNAGLEASKPLRDTSDWDRGGVLGSPVKNKHMEEEDGANMDSHEVKRLKFDNGELEEGKEVCYPALAEPLSEAAEEMQSSPVVREAGEEGEVKLEAASSLMLEGQDASSMQREPSLTSGVQEGAKAAASAQRPETDRETVPPPSQVQPAKVCVSVMDGRESCSLVSSSCSSSAEQGTEEAVSNCFAVCSESGLRDAALHEEPMEQD